MKENPIGIFDSGIGGLTVLAEIYKELPLEDTIYFGDTARVPYGTKSEEVVKKFSRENAYFLLKQKIKSLIVACNTASALALPILRKELNLPVIGVIAPGVKKAGEVTQNKRIGVIGTEATIRSSSYPRALHSLDSELKVFSQACSLFVPLVEEGWLNKEVTHLVAQEYLTPLLKQNIDTLILGCTHYPLLKGIMREIVGPKINLIDSACEVAKEVQEVLSKKGLLREENDEVNHKFFVTDAPEKFVEIGEKFLGRKISEEVRYMRSS